LRSSQRGDGKTTVRGWDRGDSFALFAAIFRRNHGQRVG
jgi:hypothetical protein